MRTGKTGLIPRRAKSFWLAVGVLSFSLACRVASGQHYTYGQIGEFGSSRFPAANPTVGTAMDSVDDMAAIRFTALENVTFDRVHLRCAVTGSVSFTVGIMADNGAGKPSGTYLSLKETNLTSVTLTTNPQEIVFDSPLNLSNGSIYHIVTQPTAVTAPHHLRLQYVLGTYGVRPFDRASDTNLNMLLKLNGAALWGNALNYTPFFVLANGSSTGFVIGPGQPYYFSQVALPMGGSTTGKARGQSFVITDREVPIGAYVSVTQVVVKVDKAGTVTNDVLVELRDTGAALTLLGSTVLSNSLLNTTADTLSFPSPVLLKQGRKYLLTFEFVGPPPSATANKINIEYIRAIGFNDVTWGGGADGVVVDSAASYSWTGYTTSPTYADGYDLVFGLNGLVMKKATGALMVLR